MVYRVNADRNIVLTASPLWGLTGEVLDSASLNIFWDELIQGAYGEVARARGILEIVDGRSFYFSFGIGLDDCTYFELKVKLAISFIIQGVISWNLKRFRLELKKALVENIRCKSKIIIH